MPATSLFINAWLFAAPPAPPAPLGKPSAAADGGIATGMALLEQKRNVPLNGFSGLLMARLSFCHPTSSFY